MTHHIRREILPFTAIVGQEKMKKSLILNAINPRIGGVLIGVRKGLRSPPLFVHLLNCYQKSKWLKAVLSIAILITSTRCATCATLRKRMGKI
ncbi:MAG: hypothetical protein N2V78_04865 [Methanophagales archaeon]|nr:hypothetical protein [Methanophagales archaeon]